MKNKAPQDIIDALDDLLERERTALLQGDLDKITRLLSEKESLIDALNTSTVAEQNILEALQDKVVRNQALLDSALRGIRSVAAWLSTLRQIRKSLETYDETGKRTTFEGLRKNNVEKRA